jgi:RNA polymerase sigma-70 factor (ECF subfamily)
VQVFFTDFCGFCVGVQTANVVTELKNWYNLFAAIFAAVPLSPIGLPNRTYYDQIKTVDSADSMSAKLAGPIKPLSDPETWLDEYGDALYRFALARIKDPSVAEDLVQETFLAGLGARKNFKGRSTTKTWLIAILKHKIIDHIRKKSREQDSDKLESLADGIDINFTGRGDWRTRPTKWVKNPIKLYEQKEFMDVLYRCLGELPIRQSEAFILREMDGLSTEEICKELNITATNSWVILYRARMLLRQCLETNWINSEG